VLESDDEDESEEAEESGADLFQGEMWAGIADDQVSTHLGIHRISLGVPYQRDELWRLRVQLRHRYRCGRGVRLAKSRRSRSGGRRGPAIS